MPNANPRPWRMFLPLGIVLALAVAWTVYWFVALGIARERLQEMRARFDAQGLTLTCATESWGGFPFHFEFSCTSPVVTMAGKAEARSGNLLLMALAYAPRQIVALLDGPTTVSAGKLGPLTASHERAVAAITFDGGEQPNVSSEFPAVAIEGLGSADMLRLYTRPGQAGGTDIAITATKLTYQPPGKPALASDEANLLGTFKDARNLKIDKIDARQGQLRLAGSGSVALDDQHRPAGQLDAETNDIGALIALLSPQFNLTDDQAAGLRAMLGLLGSEAKVPVIAREGALYLGPFKIADLKPLY